MESLRKKLGVLREAQRGLQDDIRANTQLGEEVGGAFIHSYSYSFINSLNHSQIDFTGAILHPSFDSMEEHKIVNEG